MVEQTTELEPGEAWNRAVTALMVAGRYGGQGTRTAAGRITRRAGAAGRQAGQRMTAAGGRARRRAGLATSETGQRFAAAYGALRGIEASRQWRPGEPATIASAATTAGALAAILILYSRWRRPVRPTGAHIRLGVREHGRRGQSRRAVDASGPALGDQTVPPEFATTSPHAY